jgi:hypothetical protein
MDAERRMKVTRDRGGSDQEWSIRETLRDEQRTLRDGTENA